MEATDDAAENGNRLIKNNMAENDDAASGHVKAVVSLVRGWIS
jgi:hypothetical protein